ncbi:MAG: DUF1217 domain-containing protein [Litoreibacter sp.]
MTFVPALPATGLNGWVFLQRTAQSQQEAISENQSVKRLTENFTENIPDVRTAEALVADRRLLTVALQAYGLEDDIDNKFYIQKVLESDPADPESFANSLADKRYLKMAEAFGFGSLLGPSTNLNSFAANVVSLYETKEFEARIGDIDEDMRLALGLERDLGEIASSSSSNDTKWFSIMGDPPLRRVFEVSLGLPSSLGSLDIDRQLEIFKERAQSVLKTDQISEIGTENNIEELTRTFLLRAQIDTSIDTSGGSIALTLLQSAPNLFA